MDEDRSLPKVRRGGTKSWGPLEGVLPPWMGGWCCHCLMNGSQACAYP